MFSIYNLVEILYNKDMIPYKERIISLIDDEGRDTLLESSLELSKYSHATIKIENLEKYNQQIFDYCKELAIHYEHNGPVTCHAFYAIADAYSFPTHTDPDDVYLYCCEGTKTLVVDGNEVILNEGESIFIPANTPHKATNKYESLMLSFGLEKFIQDKLKGNNDELDVLSKNNRNV